MVFHSNQLILSPADSEAVRELARRAGKTADELLHETVANLLRQSTTTDRLAALRQARGIWEHREDLPDFGRLRAEGWERTNSDTF